MEGPKSGSNNLLGNKLMLDTASVRRPATSPCRVSRRWGTT